MEGEEIAKKIEQTHLYSGNILAKFLKYIGKLREISNYEDWLKETNKLLLNWIITYLIILPFIFFLCLAALGFVRTTSDILTEFLRAEGLSIAWYLIVNLKKDLWRKNG